MWRLLRPDAVYAFKDGEIRSSLPRYIDVVEGRKLAKHLICKMVGSGLEKVEDESTGVLWRVHDSLLKEQKELERRADEGGVKKLRKPERELSLMEVKVELARRMLRSCEYCERRCRVNREAGEKGFCRLGSEARVASFFEHVGEEAPLVPSGTIFFASCNFRCVYCQNWDISTDPENGEVVTPGRLAAIMRYLAKSGCRNINFVGGDPTPDLHVILEAVAICDVNIPLIWNSNLYNSVEAMRLLQGVIDLWLPDFKYWSNDCARRLSKVDGYRGVVTRNLKIAYEWGEMIIRHLVLPSHLECCTKPILEWIAKNLPGVLVNVMSQYRPQHKAYEYKEISRRPTYSEMRLAYRWAEELGLKFRSVS